LSWSWAVIFARPDGPETIGGTDSRLGSCLLCHKELWFPPFGACMQGVREFRSDIVAGLRASDRGVARRSWPWGCRSRDRCVAYGVEPGCRLRAASRAGVTAADGGFCGHRCAGTRIPAPAAIPWARRVVGEDVLLPQYPAIEIAGQIGQSRVTAPDLLALCDPVPGGWLWAGQSPAGAFAPETWRGTPEPGLCH
jgi:hypothetical protein